jgi:hypothetical protein
MRVRLPVSTAVAPFGEIVQHFQRKFREEATLTTPGAAGSVNAARPGRIIFPNAGFERPVAPKSALADTPVNMGFKGCARDRRGCSNDASRIVHKSCERYRKTGHYATGSVADSGPVYAPIT